MFSSYIYAFGVVAMLLLGGYVLDLKNNIATLEEELSEANKTLFMQKLVSSNCLEEVEIQNKEFIKIANEKERLIADLDAWMAKPPKVRYETIYKKIPSLEVKSDECKDIKNLINDIRNSGF
jgi:hypothetical protein